jgi:hypothetical protein
MSPAKPAFLITIDTEGDNLWTAPKTITTENSRYLPRFQKLCERYAFKPTWLTNYEMAECPGFYELGREVLERNAGEIGMHLHAWNSPPLTGANPGCQAYLIEYPESVMNDKIRFLTELLERRFERKMVSHRAGRWALNSRYATLLVKNGYLVDCSVTPHVSWTSDLGDPGGSGGSDYTAYPARPYFMDLDQIDREGNSPLLEVPMTIVSKFDVLHRLATTGPSIIQRGLRPFLPALTSWLRPNGRNRSSMLAILERASDRKWPCLEFMLHSSELMPGGSPTFRTRDDIEALYDDLEALLSKAAEQCRGATLSEFAEEYRRSSSATGA